jgi:hypothetical protein
MNEELYNSLLESGLFKINSGGNKHWLVISNTNIFYAWDYPNIEYRWYVLGEPVLLSGGIIKVPEESFSFENSNYFSMPFLDLIDLLPDEMQYNFLFHLDLIRKIPNCQ